MNLRHAWLLALAGLLPAAERPPPAVPPPPAPAATAAAVPAAAGPALPDSPAVNWVLPIFSDREGHRLMKLQGTEVRPVDGRIAITNLMITTFTGDARAAVDSILLSPRAVFSPKDHTARGEQTVRFIQDDVEVTGTRWAYEHAAKKVSLEGDVRVTFRARITDILR
ncbi:MAG: hypothetical protein FJ397_11975 [Verrucomicrobia bacterium]|nr:hypothetical protein [Verrucomicrobiota bacterium]